MTIEHIVARVFLQEDRYLLGVYDGKYGTHHIGFDKVDLVARMLRHSECLFPVSEAGWWARWRGRDQAALVDNYAVQGHVEEGV